ncbi:nuclear body protein SP140-like protein isoform 2-T2 [Glossophaga mutica]
MASRSIRMSAENQKLMSEIALKQFKEDKTRISDAIKTPYPFLETLCDKGFITDEIYKDSKRSWKNPKTVPKVVYAVLNKVEEIHHLPLLEILFSKFFLKNYPDLNGICEDFRDAILKEISHQASVGNKNAENRDTELSIEQGTGENPYPSFSWLFPDQSKHAVTSSEDSAERRNREKPPKASTSALKRKPVKDPEASSESSAKKKRPEAGSSAVRSGADQEGATQQLGVSVNFRAQILRVTCREMKGLLIKRKLEQGATRKCIRTEDGNWLTPREFELRGGYQASNWKTSLTCGGTTLKELIKLGYIHAPPIMRERINQEENSGKCKICQDGGRLFRCEKCQSFFHGDCHLPPVDTTRNGWNCIFCTVENSSQSQRRYRESEVLEKQMGPEEKLKCEFLLLKVYHHLESNIFPNIPHGNYITKASQYLGKLRKLDTIKKKLITENYRKVKDFMEAMDKVFQGVSSDKLHLNQEDFMKNFKRVFAIQEAN